MSQEFYTLITLVGQAKIANAVALGRSIKLSEIAVSDWDGNPTQDQKKLHNEVYRGRLNSIGGDKSNNPNWITAEAILPQDVGGWYVREVGIYDADGDLFAVAKYPATYKPVLSGGAGKDLYIKTILEVSNAEVVELKIDPAVVLASREFVNRKQVFYNTVRDAERKLEGDIERVVIVELSDTPFEKISNEIADDYPEENKFQDRAGQWWGIVKSKHRDLNHWKAVMASGGKFRIACYGDSTTDGNGTTGHQYNRGTGNLIPSAGGGGSNVGQSYHTTESPNSWPNVLLSTLREYYPSADIDVWNAGYSGQQMNTGWARANYSNAVIKNPYYGVPDVCFIGFGLNDITENDLSELLEDHVRETELLCKRMLRDGTYPVLLTCDANSQQGESRENTEASRILDTAKQELSNRLGIGFIDIDEAMKAYIIQNEDMQGWADIQPDGLHYGDLGHAYKAGFLATCLMRDFYNADGTSIERVVWQDSRAKFGYKNDDSWLGNNDNEYSRNRLAFNIAHNEFNGTAILDAWVFVTHSAQRKTSLIYRGLSSTTANTKAVGNFEPDKWAALVVDSVTLKNKVYDSPLPTSGFYGRSSFHAFDMPLWVCNLPMGLNRIRIEAPKNPAYTIYGGFFEVSPYWHHIGFNSNTTSENNELNTFCYHTAIKDIVYRGSLDGDVNNSIYQQVVVNEKIDGTNTYSLTNKNDVVVVSMEAFINPSDYLAIGGCNSYVDKDISGGEPGNGAMLLMQIVGDEFRLSESISYPYRSLYKKALTETGATGDDLAPIVNGLSDYGYDQTLRHYKITVRLTLVDYGRIKLEVFKGLNNESDLIASYEHTKNDAGLIPQAGTVGGAWFHNQAGSGTVEHFALLKTFSIKHNAKNH